MPLLGWLCWVCCGCASAPKPASPPPPPSDELPCVPIEEQLEIRIIPSASLNHDREGQPRSVQFRIYQLRNALAFRNVSFDDLWFGDDHAALGESLVAVAPELTVVPGETTSVPMERHVDAAWLGVVGQFRQHAPGGAWLQVTPLPRKTLDCIPHAGADPPIRKLTVKVGLSDYDIHPFVGQGSGGRGA